MEYTHCCKLLLVCSVLVLSFCSRGARCELTDDFYDNTCPDVYPIVQQHVFAAMRAEMRMGASLLRLHFHDCFVNVSTVTYISSELTLNVLHVQLCSICTVVLQLLKIV